MEIKVSGTVEGIVQFIRNMDVEGRLEVTIREERKEETGCTPITTESSSGSETGSCLAMSS
jgi:hypothetical protein